MSLDHCIICGEHWPAVFCRHTYEQRVCHLAGVDAGDPLDRGTLVKVHRAMRTLDQSDLWPIRDRFNATNRAIRRVRELRHEYDLAVVEYAESIHHEIGRIVNAY